MTRTVHILHEGVERDEYYSFFFSASFWLRNGFEMELKHFLKLIIDPFHSKEKRKSISP